MANLFIILLLLFAALAVVVMLTERYGKRLEPEEQSRMWRILVVLIGIMLIARIIQFYAGG